MLLHMFWACTAQGAAVSAALVSTLCEQCSLKEQRQLYCMVGYSHGILALPAEGDMTVALGTRNCSCDAADVLAGAVHVKP
jgi:hypothetical protein